MPNLIEACWLGGYCATIFALGWLAVAWAHGPGRLSLVEWLGRSWAYGMVVAAFLMYWAAQCSCLPRRSLLVGMALLAGVGLGRLAWHRRLPWPGWPASPRWRWSLAGGGAALALAVVACAVGTVVVAALAMPLYDIDSFQIYGLKAKVLYFDGLSAEAYFQQVNYGYSHLEYPLLGPLLSAGTYAALGHPDDQLGKLPYALQYAAFACLLLAMLRRNVSRTMALPLVASLLGLPALVQWAGGGTVDLLLAMFYAGSVFHLAAFLRSGTARELRPALLFTIGMAFTKNEGIALAIINFAVVALCLWPGASADRGRRFRPLLQCLAGFLALWLTWALWAATLPDIHERYGGRLGELFSPAAWARLPVIAQEFLHQVVAWRRWGGFWLIMPALCWLCPARLATRHGLAIAMMLTAHAMLYVMVFMITPWGVEHLAAMAMERLLTHLAPALLLLAAVALGQGSPSPDAALAEPGLAPQAQVPARD